MDDFLFDGWVKELDRKFKRKSQKFAIIVDNCLVDAKIDGLKFAIYPDNYLAHPKIDDFKAVELVFLPPRTTSKTQS